MGFESRSDGVHRIHRTRIDSIGHVEFLFVKHLENCHQAVREGVEIRSDGVHRIHRTRIDSIGHVEFLFVRHLENCHQAFRGGRKSFRWSPSDLIDSIGHLEFLFVRHLENCHQAVREGVEIRSDGVHRIHRTRIDSIGHVEFLFVRHLENCHQAVREGVEIRSDPSDTNGFHRTCRVSVRKTLGKISVMSNTVE